MSKPGEKTGSMQKVLFDRSFVYKMTKNVVE